METDLPRFGIKPSSSPRPARRRRSRSSGSQSDNSKLDRAVSPENARTRRKKSRQGEDDDPDYTALVKRLQERIKKRPRYSDDEQPIQMDSSKPEKPKSDRTNLSQTAPPNKMQPDPMNYDSQKVSFVDMFSFSSSHDKNQSKTDDENTDDVINASLDDKQLVMETVTYNEVDGVENESKIETEDKVTDRKVETKKKAPVMDETTPLFPKPENEERNVLRRRTSTKADQIRSDRESPQTVIAAPPDVDVEESEPDMVTIENPHPSLWRRFLGVFSCFVLFCGVWKCLSK